MKSLSELMDDLTINLAINEAATKEAMRLVDVIRKVSKGPGLVSGPVSQDEFMKVHLSSEELEEMADLSDDEQEEMSYITESADRCIGKETEG